MNYRRRQPENKCLIFLLLSILCLSNNSLSDGLVHPSADSEVMFFNQLIEQIYGFFDCQQVFFLA